jgi:hypothetical protein
MRSHLRREAAGIRPLGASVERRGTRLPRQVELTLPPDASPMAQQVPELGMCFGDCHGPMLGGRDAFALPS